MIRVSDNRRFLVQDDGSPFFYLGDTAWELFHRCTREEAEMYLRDRAAKGFTVIQAVALAELDGLTVPNPNGDLPLLDKDPTRPCMDAEPGYEDMASQFKLEEGYLDDYDVRKALYWALFAGAHGHTYGCNPVWQMWLPGRNPMLATRRSWYEALHLPGSSTGSTLEVYAS